MQSLMYVTNVCCSLTSSWTQDHLPTRLQGTDVRDGWWSESHNPNNMSKQLFRKKGLLSSSLFNKLINTIPLLCLYPNRTLLPVELRNKTTVHVTGIENSLRDAVGSDNHYIFHKAVATFNTDFLCHFVKRVALCLLLNSKETRGHFWRRNFLQQR